MQRTLDVAGAQACRTRWRHSFADAPFAGRKVKVRRWRVRRGKAGRQQNAQTSAWRLLPTARFAANRLTARARA